MKLINLSEAPLDEEMAKTLRDNADQLLIGVKMGNENFKPLSSRYILAIIEEYNRCLMEHQIP